MDVCGDLTSTLEATPGAFDTLSMKFVQSNWISLTAKTSARELVLLACQKIEQKASEYSTIYGMLKDTNGMDIILGRLEGI